MAPKWTPKNATKKPKKASEIIELSSDSEPDAPAVEENASEPPKDPAPKKQDYADIPLLRAAGIKYQPTAGEDVPSAGDSKPAKLPVRVKDTGSAKHRHVSIEIPLLTSSMRTKAAKSQEEPGSEDANEEDVFKTPMERRHITFNDSDNEEFVTPMEPPPRNPLETAMAARKEEIQDSQEEGEDSDDEAPPEAISSHAAEAHLAKTSQAAAKAAQKQAAAQKRKRQERDAFLKQQAEKRNSAQVPSVPESEGESEEPRPQSPAPLFPEKRKREVPKILPLEFLESDDEDEAEYPGSSVGKGVTKKQKLATGWVSEARGPRDQKVGSTVFRVVENHGDKKLAPKAKKTAVHMREALLKRKKAPQANSGFFVKSH